MFPLLSLSALLFLFRNSIRNSQLAPRPLCPYPLCSRSGSHSDCFSRLFFFILYFFSFLQLPSCCCCFCCFCAFTSLPFSSSSFPTTSYHRIPLLSFFLLFLIPSRYLLIRHPSSHSTRHRLLQPCTYLIATTYYSSHLSLSFSFLRSSHFTHHHSLSSDTLISVYMS